jgi:opacity protein-like surface antigen
MKKTLLTLFAMAICLHSWAQAPTNTKPVEQTPAATKSEAEAKASEGGNPGSAIGLNLSTNGVGLQFAQNIGSKRMLAVRVGGMYMPFKLTNFEYDFDGTKLVINGDIKLGSVQALVDFHPFKNAFKITCGLAYMLSDISATAMVKDSVKQGDIMISPDEVGKIDVGIKVGPICPYVGIGFGRAVPKTRFSFNFEVGGYFITKPQVSFKASGMLEPTSSNEKVLQDNMSGFTWLPMMTFGFNFKIGK